MKSYKTLLSKKKKEFIKKYGSVYFFKEQKVKEILTEKSKPMKKEIIYR